MLMLTPTAVEAVRDITSGDGAPQDAGLRISTPDDAESFQLAVADGPSQDDEVLSAEGARIFMDPKSAAFFDDKILDAGLDTNGNATFVVGPQATTP
ncbi:hypothetical protein ACWDUL_24105 [Nocardia niigatensis]